MDSCEFSTLEKLTAHIVTLSDVAGYIWRLVMSLPAMTFGDRFWLFIL